MHEDGITRLIFIFISIFISPISVVDDLDAIVIVATFVELLSPMAEDGFSLLFDIHL